MLLLKRYKLDARPHLHLKKKMMKMKDLLLKWMMTIIMKNNCSKISEIKKKPYRCNRFMIITLILKVVKKIMKIKRIKNWRMNKKNAQMATLTKTEDIPFLTKVKTMRTLKKEKT
jgi:hypothetical protein